MALKGTAWLWQVPEWFPKGIHGAGTPEIDTVWDYTADGVLFEGALVVCCILGPFGPTLEPFGVILEPFGAIWSQFGGILSPAQTPLVSDVFGTRIPSGNRYI